MPYSIDDPPEKIKDMPKGAQEIFISAFNNALKQYEGDEERANKVAYNAVKAKYKQDAEGNWIAKEVKVKTKEAVHPHGEHICVCSACKHELEVEAGEKCNEQKCPECGEPMVAKEPGERRESMKNMDLLQQRYSQIIQEAGKRNASLDVGRIKKILALCQELLSSDGEDEKKVTEALTEASAV